MKIGYLINQYPAVSHTFIRREILALEAQGVTVERFAIRGWDAELVDPLDRQELLKTRHTLKDGPVQLLLAALFFAIRHPLAFFSGLKLCFSMSKNALRPWPYHLIYLAHACKLMGWLKDSDIGHVHAHFGTNSTEIAALVHAIGGPGYSFTVHGSEVHEDAKQNRLDLKLSKARFAATVCKYIGAQLMRRTNLADWGKVKTVHCGLPEGAFAGADHPLPKSPVFLSIGRLSGEKGHLILLDAFAQVQSEMPEAQLVFGGNGPLRATLDAKIEGLGIASSVRFAGWIASDQVREELQNAHVLVQPSFNEGLPMVIMEAMAQKRAVISTYIAGIPELVIPGETGWLVPAGDVSELAAAMVESARAPRKTLQAMGQAGFERVGERHAIATEAAKLKRHFDEVLGQ